MYYFKKVLGQILEGEQPELESAIETYLEGYEQSFENLSISEAVKFLRENWEYLEQFYR